MHGLSLCVINTLSHHKQNMTSSIQHHSRWQHRLLQPNIIIGGLFLISLLVYLALIPVPRVDGQLIGSDGVGYYMYARSLIIDHDLDFTNEYAYYHAAIKSPGLTPLGTPGNKYAIGPALLWLPFFLIAHVLALIGNGVGLPIQPDGYGYLYQSAISIGSIVYGSIGIWLAYRCARQFFAAIPTLLSVTLIWLAGNVVYYMIFEPSMSHMVSLFSTSLLLSIWFWWFRTNHAPTTMQAIVLGMSGGLVMLVRSQDAVFLLFPYLFLLVRFLQSWRTGERKQTIHWLKTGIIVAIATIITFSPQLLIWKLLYGTWTTPYLSDHDPAFYWLQPRIVSVLFSTFHGLFLWHPILLIALFGLSVVASHDTWMAIGLGLVLALNLYIIAAWWAWWQGDSFGGRMFINATWVWIVGLAGFLHHQWKKPSWHIPILASSILLIIWNGLSLIQYRLGFVPMSEPLSWQEMTIDRILLPWTLIQKILH